MSVVRGIAGTRACVGLALTIATRPFLRLAVRDEPHSGSVVLFARTVGIRDLVFGSGSYLAAASPDSAHDLRRWLTAWLASDIADMVAGMTASREVGRSGALAAAAVPLPFVAAGLWALRRLPVAAPGFRGRL